MKPQINTDKHRCFICVVLWF